jgi:hypothetical protein
MRSLIDQCHWRPIEEAPLEEAVDVLVTDFCGSIYPLQYPCRRTSEGWISAIGTRDLVVDLRCGQPSLKGEVATFARWLPTFRNLA